MRSRIVAAERESDSEQAEHERPEAVHHGDERQEDREDDHLDDKHQLAAERIGQAAEADGTDQNAQQRGRADDAVLPGRDVELARNQRQRDARHEHH